MERRWAVFTLAVSLLFLIAGSWLAFVTAKPIAWATIGMGIVCFVPAFGTLRDQRNNRGLRDVVALEVPGGVPLQATVWQQRLQLANGVGLFGMPLFFIERMPAVIAWPSLFLAALLLVALVASFLGVLPQPSLTFRPSGLTVSNGRRYDYEIDWDNFAAVAPGTFSGNEAVFIVFADPSRVRVLGRLTAVKFQKSIVSNRAFASCDLVLMARQFGLTGGQLATAIHTYVQDPTKRSRLVGALPAAEETGRPPA